MLVSNIKRILKTAVFFMILSYIIVFIDVNLSETTGFSLDGAINNYFESSEDYDVISIGSSTMYAMYNPEIADEITGKKSLNFGSAVQGMDDTYFLLKNMYQYGTPEYVIIGTGIGRIMVDDYEYGSEVLLSALPESRYRKRLFIKEYQVKDLLRYFRIDPKEFSIIKLLDGTYFSYFKYFLTGEPDLPKEYGNGFTYLEGEFENAPISEYQFAISERAEKYLRKSIELCQRKGSKVILVNTPISPEQFSGSEVMDRYNDYFNSVADEYGVENWDLSFLKKEHIEYTNYNFGDHVHTNGRGGNAYSYVVGNMLKDYIDGDFNPLDYFYQTHAECVTGQNLSE